MLEAEPQIAGIRKQFTKIIRIPASPSPAHTQGTSAHKKIRSSLTILGAVLRGYGVRTKVFADYIEGAVLRGYGVGTKVFTDYIEECPGQIRHP